MIDLPPHDLVTVRRILAQHIPECEVWAFGSRVTWTAKSQSDLDLVVVGEEPLPLQTLAALGTAFEESPLPITVDVLDWHRISPEFRRNIERQYETLQEPRRGESPPPDWAFHKLGDIAEIVTGGTPKTSRPEYWGGEIPWLTVEDLASAPSRHICSSKRSLTEAGLASCSARLVPAGSILLSTRATVGHVALASCAMATHQGIRSLLVKDEHNPDFVYYLLRGNADYLRLHAAGATFRELSTSTLKSLRFLMPPLREQGAIAHVLGTLDELIELNRSIRQTLEAIVGALSACGASAAAPTGIPPEKASPSSVPRPHQAAITTLARVARGREKQAEIFAALRDTLLPKLLSGELRVG